MNFTIRSAEEADFAAIFDIIICLGALSKTRNCLRSSQ